MPSPTDISQVLLANTFDEWRITTNLLVDDVNDLARGDYTKPTGNVVVETGYILISTPSGTTLTVAADALISGNLTVGGNLVANGVSAGSVNNAANTVTVYANSGSIRIANSINFVNTSTINVSVSAGSTGNANISFTVNKSDPTLIGAQGYQGVAGSAGSAGPQGQQGAQGFQGVQGTNGTIGTQGAQGFQGVQGASGTAGSITDETASSSTYYPLMTTSTSGTLSTVNVSSTKLNFIPSTGTLSTTTFNSTSDANLKDVVRNITNATLLINTLDGVEFTWNEVARKIGVSEDTRTQIGVIAQQVESLYPSLIHVGEDGYKRVDYDRIIAILIESIKELNIRLSDLENK